MRAMCIEKTLQSSAQGVVELVFLPDDENFLFVKKTYRKLALDMGRMNNVRRECQIHACLTHENIVHLYAYGETETEIVLLMEYVSGATCSSGSMRPSPSGA